MTEWVDDKGANKIGFILKHFWLCHNFVWCVLWHHTSVYCSLFYESFFLKKMLCIESLIISTNKTGLLPIHMFLMFWLDPAVSFFYFSSIFWPLDCNLYILFWIFKTLNVKMDTLLFTLWLIVHLEILVIYILCDCVIPQVNYPVLIPFLMEYPVFASPKVCLILKYLLECLEWFERLIFLS